MSHSNFTEVTGMVFVEVDSVVVLTTSKTSTSTVTTFSVLTDATLAMGDLATHFSGFLEPGSHFLVDLQSKKITNFKSVQWLSLCEQILGAVFRFLPLHRSRHFRLE